MYIDHSDWEKHKKLNAKKTAGARKSVKTNTKDIADWEKALDGMLMDERDFETTDMSWRQKAPASSCKSITGGPGMKIFGAKTTKSSVAGDQAVDDDDGDIFKKAAAASKACMSKKLKL
eukprot:8947293-Pyramimonas_sp.AAC.1